MKKTDIKITRFEDGDFWVDIVENVNDFEAWLTRKDCGVADLMFGAPKQQIDRVWDFDRFCELVEGNLEEYEANYNTDHCEEEE